MATTPTNTPVSSVIFPKEPMYRDAQGRPISGTMSLAWIRWFNNVFDRIGGAEGINLVFEDKSLVPIFRITGSPVTSLSSEVDFTLNVQNSNTILAGPISGSAEPEFRSLLNSDLPVIDVPHGGTGQTLYTIGDILYASSTTTLTQLNDVVVGNALLSGGVGVPPLWGKIDLTTAITNTLPIANGGTGQITAPLAINALLPSQSGNSGKFLTTDGTNVLWAGVTSGTVVSVSVVTANGVSGSVATSTTTPAITLTLGAITPSSVAATGGITGSAIQSLSGNIISAGTLVAAGNVSGANLSGTNTGDQTITLTGAVTGSGMGSFATTYNSTLGTTLGGTNITSYTTGDIIYASASNVLSKRAIGTTGQVITVVGGVPSWSNTPTLTGTNFTGIPNAGLTNSSLTIGSTSISLGGVATSLTGLTSVTSTGFTGALSGTASGNLPLSGGQMSGLISSTVGEAFRMINTNGFLDWYNTSNTTRTGYIQGNSASNLTIASENGAIMILSVSGAARLNIDTGGNIITKFGIADQSYSRQTPITGFSITIAAGVQTLILSPAATLLSGTITLPAAPVDGQIIYICSSTQITTLTISANSGQSLGNAFSGTLIAGTGISYIYVLSNTTWYRRS